jgi:hypothetical protein
VPILISITNDEGVVHFILVLVRLVRLIVDYQLTEACENPWREKNVHIFS